LSLDDFQPATIEDVQDYVADKDGQEVIWKTTLTRQTNGLGHGIFLLAESSE